MSSRLFRRVDDRAVSPVIAVILMVAITVVLAATVYVWVSGFGASSSTPAHSIALTKQKAGYYQTMTIASATPGLRWSDLTFQVDGMSAYDVILADGGANTRSTSFAPSNTGTILAGDTVYLVNGATSAATGTLRILDTQANSVILTLSGIATDAATSATPTAGTTLARVSGSAGSYGDGDVLRVTFDQPVQPSSLTLGTSVTIDAHDFTGVTLSMTSPTTALLTFSAGGTIDGTETLTFETNVKDVTGAGITSFTEALGGI